MKMIISVISYIKKGEEIPVNSKGFEELEIDPSNNITSFSKNKKFRYVGINNNVYRLSMKSYKELKKYLQKTNLIYSKKIA